MISIGGREGARRSWRGLFTRCYNPQSPNYKWYGGKGIKVCERWTAFSAFFEDMGPRPENTSIDRIDGDKDYEPSNCRWATGKMQHRNTKSNRILTLNGVSKCMSEWCEEKGLTFHVVFNRIARGWSVERALTTPKANHTREVKGRSIAEWSRETGIPASIIQLRLSRGWTEENAIRTPVLPNDGTRRRSSGLPQSRRT